MTSTRQSRESEAHDNKTRRKPWRPVRRLETPPAPDGYVYRWIRESMLGQEDRSNMSISLREGWELVKGADLPDEWQLPTMDEGRHSGVVYNEGLILAKIPQETVNERNAHYEAVNQNAKDALDNTMFSESSKDSRYVKYDPQRSTQVTFGRN